MEVAKTKKESSKAEDRVRDLINPMIAELGLEVIEVELHLRGNRKIRLFIDKIEPSSVGITVDDCADVSRKIDGPLDQSSDISSLFGEHSYELEVSSPGINRPLREPKHFARYLGERARVHVFRPLNSNETGNPVYVEKNPKQKNFLGVLKETNDETLTLEIGDHEERIQIPYSLICKAYLETELKF